MQYVMTEEKKKKQNSVFINNTKEFTHNSVAFQSSLIP